MKRFSSFLTWLCQLLIAVLLYVLTIFGAYVASAIMFAVIVTMLSLIWIVPAGLTAGVYWLVFG